MVSFIFQNSAGIFKNLRKFVLAVGGLKDTTEAGSKIGWSESLFRVRTKKFLFNFCIYRLRRPLVNTLQENFSSKHGLKRKFSIFRMTLYFKLREIQIYPGNTRKYFSHVEQAHSVCNSSCKQMS